MKTKQELITDLKAAYQEWEKLLGTASDDQLVDRRITSRWVLKDVVAHLMAWQQITVARLEAATVARDPVLPAWLGGADPFDTEENVHEFNAKIYAIHSEVPWPEVHRAWREGFTHLIELAETIPEQALLEANRYPWLRGYALSAALEGTCGHHREHLEAVRRALAVP